MLERNRFQYHLATGKIIFPVAVVFCLISSALGLNKPENLIPLIACGITTYLLIELNTTFSLIRTRTTLHASLFLYFYSSCLFLHEYSPETWIPLLYVGSISCLFRSYESSHSSTQIFHSFLLLGIASLILPHLLYLTPLIYCFMIALRSLNPRSFFAGLIGVSTPYVLLFCYYLYNDNPVAMAELFMQLAEIPPIDYTALSLQQLVAGGLLLVLTAISCVQTMDKGYQDRVQTRIMLRIIIWSGIAVLALTACIPSYFNAFFLLLLVIYAITSGHLFALTFSRFTGILLWITAGAWILLTIFNLWTTLSNS